MRERERKKKSWHHAGKKKKRKEKYMCVHVRKIRLSGKLGRK